MCESADSCGSAAKTARRSRAKMSSQSQQCTWNRITGNTDVSTKDLLQSCSRILQVAETLRNVVTGSRAPLTDFRSNLDKLRATKYRTWQSQNHSATKPLPALSLKELRYPSLVRIVRRKNGNAPAYSGRTASDSGPASPAAATRTAPAHSNNCRPSRKKFPASAA